MADSIAGSYASLGGVEIVNDTRTFSYLSNGLGPGNINVYGDCGCSNLYDLIGCFPDTIDLEQCVDLPGVSGNYLSTPDTAANSLQGTESALALSGHSGTYASTPDSVALSITGDIDIRVKVAMDDWTPSVDQMVLSKRNVTPNFSWAVSVTSAGRVRLTKSANGTSETTSTSTVSPTVTDGATLWLRVTLDVDNGAAGHDVKFYTSDSGVTWTQLGATVTTAGITSLFDNNAPVQVGSVNDGTALNFAGRVYYAEIRNGIGGTIVANPDFTESPWVIGDQSATARADTSGNTWTLQGNAEIVAEAERRSLRLSGAAGVYASTPDSAGLSITGDIDIRVKVAADDWTPATTDTLLSKMASATVRSYRLDLQTTGQLVMNWSADGSTLLQAASTVGVGLTDGTVKWVRATLDVNNGAAGNDVKFYTSDDGTTWTQLGATVTNAGVTSIFDTTAAVEIGSTFIGTVQNFAGNVFYAEVRNGIDGTIVANADFQKRPWDVGDTSTATGTDTSGNTWTLNGTGAVIKRAFASDLDIRVKVAMDDWTPSARSAFVGKWTAGTGDRSYGFGLNATGTLDLLFSLSGAVGLEAISSVVTGITDGSTKWVRATRAFSTGTVQFFTSNDGSSWSQLGTDQSTTAGPIYDSLSTVTVGQRDGTDLLAGNVYYAEVINATEGTTVALFDPTDFLADTAQTPTTFEGWTINGAAWAWCEYAALYPYYPYVSFPGYTSPTVDSAPWYSADLPTSGEFLGFITDEFTGMDSPFTRSVKQSIGNGAILSRSRLGSRELTWRGFLFGSTCCGVQYGLRWLAKTLSRFNISCRDCAGDDLELLVCCPDESSTESPFRLLKGVGLIEGPTILSERKVCTGCSGPCGGSCILEVEFTLVATQPYFYSPEIPVYDCVSITEGAVSPPLTDETVECGPVDCSDFFYDVGGVCPLPSLPPTATYTNSCFNDNLVTANYYTVQRSLWPDLEEVVPVISITAGLFPLSNIRLGFYSSNSDSPCGDLVSFPPDCDVMCDNLDILGVPSRSTFYIDGRTRKMSVICEDGTAYPGERLTAGPWSWPVFTCFGFCLELRYDGPQFGSYFNGGCISISLVPRTF